MSYGDNEIPDNKDFLKMSGCLAALSTVDKPGPLGQVVLLALPGEGGPLYLFGFLSTMDFLSQRFPFVNSIVSQA